MSDSTRLREPLEEYRQRRIALIENYRHGSWHVKLYGIHPDIDRPFEALIDPAVLNVVKSSLPSWIAEADAFGAHHHTGFVIVHQGKEAMWVLVHWWVRSDICCHRLFRAQETPSVACVPVVTPEMACVWELVVIDYERRLWIASALSSSRDLERYHRSSLPSGDY